MKHAAAFATFVSIAYALNGVVAPSSVKAGEEIEVTFENASNDNYRVYLAAALSGVNGPTCYLINSTTLDAPVNLTVPADIGPSATYYSIAIADLTSGQGATYSNRFNLTGATGNYSEYENSLEGSPFWSADDLPCESYKCARECAMKYYPEDLKEDEAFSNMKDCILDCNGVTPAASQTAPANAEATASSSTSEDASSTESGSSSTSSGAANRHVYAAGAAAAAFGALAFLL